MIGILAIAFHNSAHAAKFGLSPGSSELRQGCKYTVDIIVNTEGASTRGADAFLSYNPDEIEILDIDPGVVYKSYPGKIFGNGSIRITAFSQDGLFNGRGVLARIAFRSKPGVEFSKIYFNYSPGATTDSNIAGENANDILDGVYGAEYTFIPGPCVVEVPDLKAPWLENLRPGIDWENMVPNTNITFSIKDDRSGVDLDSLTVQTDDLLYGKKGENTFSYEGRPTDYQIVIDPEDDFITDEPVTVNIKAKDLSENAMELNYEFTVYPISECPVEVRPAAPPDYRKFLIPLLILLLASMLYNLRLYIVVKKCKRYKFFKKLFHKTLD